LASYGCTTERTTDRWASQTQSLSVLISPWEKLPKPGRRRCVVAHTRVPRSSLVQQAFEKGALKSVSQQRPKGKHEGHPFVPGEGVLSRRAKREPWSSHQSSESWETFILCGHDQYQPQPLPISLKLETGVAPIRPTAGTCYLKTRPADWCARVTDTQS